MKKVSFIITLCAGLFITAQAQKLPASKVPAPVKAGFTKQFPGLSPSWEKENGKYEANFKDKGKSMSALFDLKGTMTESEISIKVEELPASVLAYVQQHYKSASIKEAARITKADGSINYEAEVNKMDVLFDVNGKFIKEAKD
ncbi:PepSY-like domain-containing protein [Flavitalea flava]